jgi:hypothetical protein
MEDKGKMKKQVLLAVLVFAVAAAAFAVINRPTTATTLSETLQLQSVPDIEVAFQYGSMPMKYVRIRGMLYAERPDSKASFDRDKKESRWLNSRKEGELSDQLPLLLDSQAIMETGLYSLPDGYLFEIVARGKVTEEDGLFKVITPGVKTPVTYTVYLDPEMGYNPSTLEVARLDGASVTTAEFSDYKEVAKGVWFPYQIRHLYVERGETLLDVTAAVTSLNTDKHPSKDELKVKFPQGAIVRKGSAVYRVP